MKKKTYKPHLLFFFLLFTAVVFTIPLTALSATIDPSFRFSTIETAHFSIHFHQGEDETANRAAAIAEDIHQKLSGSFQWYPKEKTQIVLIDHSDFANGFANVLPYNMIYIFAVPPMPDMTIAEYDDWLGYIILHEYTHIITMDTSRGYSEITRSIFGKPLPGYDPLSFLVFLLTAPPNVFMPDWWLEGTATWAESEYTQAGRGKSPYVEMIFRMAVLEDSLPGVDQINGDIPYWPSGNIPYIYGMLLEKHIAQTYGNENIGKLSYAHAGRLPFLISGPPERITGKNYSELYEDTIADLKKDQNKKIQELNARPLTNYTKLKIEGERVTNARLSPDGRYLAINRKDPHQHEEIVIVETATLKEVAAVRRFPSDSNLSWSPDGQKLYFTQAELRNVYNLYQDIYSYDLAMRAVSRITENLRAKDVDVSSDSKQIAFVKVETGRQNISVLDIASNRINVIADFQDSALSSPRWSPDGRAIAFARHNYSGQTSIELLNVETKTAETLITNNYNNVYPSWAPDGKTIIFASDRTGVYNLFAYSITDKKLFQVSHVLGGTFHPEVSKDGKIFFTGYSSKGFYLAEMPYDVSQWSDTLSPRITPEWKSDAPKTNDLAVTPPGLPLKKGRSEEGESSPPLKKGDEGGFLKQPSEKRPYCPGKTLLPKFWMPTLSFDNDGAVFGAFTAGQDVLGYHTYILQGGYGVGHRGYYNLNYIYDRWYPTFFIRAYSAPIFYSEFFNDDDNFYERRSGFTAGARFPLFTNLETSLNLVAGFNTETLKHLTDVEGRRVDGLEVFEGRRSNVFAGLEFTNALKYPYSISREEGRNISFLYKNYSGDIGSDLGQEEYKLKYEEYIKTWKHHVLYINLKGAASGGDLIAQQAFSVGGIPGNEYSIRGFSSGFQTGKHVAKGTLEYRLPVKYILRGINTKPFFWDRVHVAAFADAGNVWGREKKFHSNDISVGVGAEARLDMVLGYKLKITPAFGIAQGVTKDGETQVYVTIYTEL
ncbi:MAG: PD40 domain-containing protein [Nitrospirae bacterium]|nr:PD40 domain-containing protein [Nitrospirota bacterium]